MYESIYDKGIYFHLSNCLCLHHKVMVEEWWQHICSRHILGTWCAQLRPLRQQTLDRVWCQSSYGPSIFCLSIHAGKPIALYRTDFFTQSNCTCSTSRTRRTPYAYTSSSLTTSIHNNGERDNIQNTDNIFIFTKLIAQETYLKSVIVYTNARKEQFITWVRTPKDTTNKDNQMVPQLTNTIINSRVIYILQEFLELLTQAMVNFFLYICFLIIYISKLLPPIHRINVLKIQ